MKPYHQTAIAERDANGRALIYPGPDGITPYRSGYPITDWKDPHPMDPRFTLASAVNVRVDNHFISNRDVRVIVVDRVRGGVVINVNENAAVITLSEAERIALIEALGGTVE